MGMMKAWYMDIEDLVYTAMMLGARTEDEVFGYAYMRDDRVDRDTVKDIMCRIYMDSLDNSNAVVYN